MNKTRRMTGMAILVAATAALALSGCLFSIDGEPEDGGVLGGGTVSLTSVSFHEDGIDPPADEDDDDTDLDTYGFGPNCTALAVCVCEGLSPGQYQSCIDQVEEMSEAECLSILENDYPECLPDGGLSD